MITVIQPDPLVPLDRFADWLDEPVRVVQLWKDAVPSSSGEKLLILGGRQNALDEEKSPWLVQLRDLLLRAVDDAIPVLGICLGHQILATAFGGEVTVGCQQQAEEGPCQIQWLPSAQQDPILKDLGEKSMVAQSHNDAVTRLPDGAVLMGTSSTCQYQAFRIGSALGVQFHPEASPELIARWADNHGADAALLGSQMVAVDDQVRASGRAIAQAFGSRG